MEMFIYFFFFFVVQLFFPPKSRNSPRFCTMASLQSVYRWYFNLVVKEETLVKIFVFFSVTHLISWIISFYLPFLSFFFCYVSLLFLFRKGRRWLKKNWGKALISILFPLQHYYIFFSYSLLCSFFCFFLCTVL